MEKFYSSKAWLKMTGGGDASPTSSPLLDLPLLSTLYCILWKQILRDRLTVLRDHFGSSRRLKKHNVCKAGFKQRETLGPRLIDQ